MFLVSGNPNDQFPILSDILLYLRPATKTFLHVLSLRNLYPSPHENVPHENVYVNNVLSEETDVPLFSTYDAPGGFVWTEITPNGTISIHNGENFIQVLPAI